MDPVQSRQPGPATMLGLGARSLSAAAIIIGVFIALVVQILLTLLGAGIGYSAFRVPATAGEAFTVSWGAFIWWALSGILAAFAGGFAAFVWAPTHDVRSAWVHGFLTWCVATVIVMAFVALAAGSSATLMSNLGGPAAAVAGQVEVAQRGLAGEPPRMTPEMRARMDSMRRALGGLSLASFFALLLGGAAGVLGGHAAYQTFRADRPQPRVTWSIPPGWLPRRPPPPASS